MKKMQKLAALLILIVMNAGLQSLQAQSQLTEKLLGSWQLYEVETDEGTTAISKDHENYWEVHLMEEGQAKEFNGMYDETYNERWEATDSKEILLGDMEELDPIYPLKFKPKAKISMSLDENGPANDLFVKKIKKDELEIYLKDGGGIFGIARYRRMVGE